MCLPSNILKGFIGEARRKIFRSDFARDDDNDDARARLHHHFYSVLADINEFAPLPSSFYVPHARRAPLDPDLNIMRIIEHPITRARPD